MWYPIGRTTRKGDEYMSEKTRRKTTLVRVSFDTKKKIDALCELLHWDQQTVVSEAVKRIEGKVEIKYSDTPIAPAEDECPGHQMSPPSGTARLGGGSRYSVPKSIQTIHHEKS